MKRARRRLCAALALGLGVVAGCGPLVLLHDRDPDTLARVEVLGDRDEQWVAIDGEDGPRFARVLLASVEARSGHYAYAVETSEPAEGAAAGTLASRRSVSIVHDGVVVRAGLEALYALRLEPGGAHVAFVAGYKSKHVLGVDRFRSRELARIDAESLVFSADGKHAAVVADDAEGRYVVTDETTQGPFEHVDHLRGYGAAFFYVRGGATPELAMTSGATAAVEGVDAVCIDGAHAWIATRAGGMSLLAHFERELATPVTLPLTPGSTLAELRCDRLGHVAWLERRESDVRLVVDGTGAERYASSEPPTLRGGHTAFIVDTAEHTRRVVFDGSVVAEESYATSAALSADGTVLAYAARRGDQNGIVFRERFFPFDRIVTDTLVVRDDGTDFGCIVSDRRGRLFVAGSSGEPLRLPQGIFRGRGVSDAAVDEGVRRLVTAVHAIVERRGLGRDAR
jgi:hypothetical protein